MAVSLAFRSLLKSAGARAGLQKPHARLTGLTPPAVAWHAALVAQDTPVFLVVPTDADVEQMTADARFFLATIEGASEIETERRVLPFPSQEVDPYRGLLPHLEVASARARALHALATRSARVVVASAPALLPRLSPPGDLAAAGLTIAPGLEMSPQELGDRLALAGFTREDPVDEHGEFCVRGGVVDIYPAAEAQPVRLEFVGDMVESLRRYDAATQRSLVALDRITISPQRETLAGDDTTASVLDHVRGAGALVVVYEPDDVLERGRALDSQWRASGEEMRARGREVPAFETIAVPWTDVEPWLAGARHVSELAIEPLNEDQTGAALHVSTLPSIEYHGRIARLGAGDPPSPRAG